MIILALGTWWQAQAVYLIGCLNNQSQQAVKIIDYGPEGGGEVVVYRGSGLPLSREDAENEMIDRKKIRFPHVTAVINAGESEGLLTLFGKTEVHTANGRVILQEKDTHSLVINPNGNVIQGGVALAEQ